VWSRAEDCAFRVRSFGYNIAMGWEVFQKLGAGGLGEVFRAKTPEGQEVALKLLASRSNDDASSFESEVLLLSRLKHPSIVSILGCAAKSGAVFGSERGPCYWMEYVPGRDLLAATKGAKPETLQGWLIQALEALQYLHSQGVLHGDLSPHNIRIGEDGNLRLLDFGLAGTLGDVPLSAGTLPYLAPERIGGLNLPAGDLFSLGTVFYEAIAGAHPRAGALSFEELIRSKPPSLGDSLLSRVVEKMIAVDLAARLSQASEALSALRGGKAAATPGTPKPDYHSVRMIGAEAHFERLGRFLKQIGEASRAVAVHGATGVGKRRFLKEAGFQAALAGISMTTVPPGRFREELLALPDSAKNRALVFSSLEEVPAEDLALLAELKTGLLPKRGTLAFLHWNDDRLSPRSRDFLNRLLRDGALEDVRLKNLTQEETRTFLESALGQKAAAEALGEIFKTTGGNPFLLTATAGRLLERRRETGREFSATWLSDLKNFHSSEGVLKEKLRGLETPQREILIWIALAHEPVDRALFSQVTKDPLLPQHLAALSERGLVSQDGGRYRLALDSFESPLLKLLHADETKKRHRAWLAALDQRPEGDLQKIHHALRLKEEAAVRTGILEATQELIRRGRKSEALAWMDEALGVLKGADDRSRLWRAKINLLSNDLGRFQEALKACETWRALKARDEPEELKTVKYWMVTGLNLQNLGRHQDAAERFRKCLESGRSDDPDQRPFLLRAHSLLGVHEMLQGRFDAALSHLEEGLKLAEQDRRRAELLRNLAELVSRQGDWKRARRLLEEAKETCRQEAFAPGEFSALLLEGRLALDHDEPKAAVASFEKAEEIARRDHDEISLALVWSNQGLFFRKSGRIAEALERLTRAHEIFTLLGNPNDLAENLQRLAMAEAAAGRFERAGELSSGLQESALAPEAFAYLRELRDGIPALLPKSSPPAWDRESLLRRLAREKGKDPEIRNLLKEFSQTLPPDLQLSFASRHDVRRWNPSEHPSKVGGLTMPILEDLTELNRILLTQNDMDSVLKKLMEAAVAFTEAEKGFLLLKSEGSGGPVPGFHVVAAKNFKKPLESADAPSLSAVRRALQTREPVVTDNALEDPNFREAKSVHLKKLKSIIALPLSGTEDMMGVIYLDHRFQGGLFDAEKVAGLKAFAGVASLALQKARMIEGLKENNAELKSEMTAQAGELGLMHRELKKTRLALKNEYGEIVGRSPKMMEALSLVDRITESKIPVWIYGESGTGKESIARALHFNSSRAQKPFVTENCSALPENLLESELFGHKKGAFTHAVSDKKGILQYADGGTIFLDEIADMSLPLQAKLLRFLQEGEIRPIGSHQMVKVDVRVVSASNKNLQEMVKHGKFREDLFFRLNGVTVRLPPLRERLEDLALLVDHFLQRIVQREKKAKLKISPEAMRLFMNYDWPGNIRELQNVLETASLFAEGGVIGANALHFKPGLAEAKSAVHIHAPARGVEKEREKEGVNDQELMRILRAIRDQGFHRANAAKALGLSRRHFYTKLEKFGVPRNTGALRQYVDRYLG
jgi:Nif-specific regulatory protein